MSNYYDHLLLRPKDELHVLTALEKETIKMINDMLTMRSSALRGITKYSFNHNCQTASVHQQGSSASIWRRSRGAPHRHPPMTGFEGTMHSAPPPTLTPVDRNSDSAVVIDFVACNEVRKDIFGKGLNLPVPLDIQ